MLLQHSQPSPSNFKASRKLSLSSQQRLCSSWTQALSTRPVPRPPANRSQSSPTEEKASCSASHTLVCPGRWKNRRGPSSDLASLQYYGLQWAGRTRHRRSRPTTRRARCPQGQLSPPFHVDFPGRSLPPRPGAAPEACSDPGGREGAA